MCNSLDFDLGEKLGTVPCQNMFYQSGTKNQSTSDDQQKCISRCDHGGNRGVEVTQNVDRRMSGLVIMTATMATVTLGAMKQKHTALVEKGAT